MNAILFSVTRKLGMGSLLVARVSLTMFERAPLDQLLARAPLAENPLENPNQLILFE
jgi:hypothetical protein